MTIFEDYNEWYKDNHGLIETIFHDGPLLLTRLHDVFKVVHYIDEEHTLKSKLDEELLDIFEVGFGYLFDQVNQIKILLEEYFDMDMKQMNEYASVINYSLYLDDFYETILDKEEMTEEIQTGFGEVQDKIDEILKRKLPISSELFDEFDIIVNSVFSNPKHYLTVSEIFAFVAEELQL